MENEDLLKPRIFELAPGYCRHGKREFVGYDDMELWPVGYPFMTFAAFGETQEIARARLLEQLEKYIKNAKGHIHWRQGISFYFNEITKEWKAAARLIVHPYLPDGFK